MFGPAAAVRFADPAVLHDLVNVLNFSPPVSVLAHSPDIKQVSLGVAITGDAGLQGSFIYNPFMSTSCPVVEVEERLMLEVWRDTEDALTMLAERVMDVSTWFHEHKEACAFF